MHRVYSLREAFAAAVLVAFALAGTIPIQAGVADWINTTGTPDPWFHDGSNWADSIAPGTTDTARFDQPATYEVWWDSTTALTAPEVEFLQLLAGDVLFLNADGLAQHELTILGSGGAGNFADFSIAGDTTLTNQGLHLHSLGGAQILGPGTLTLDGSHAQGAQLSVDGTMGLQVDGNLNLAAGALASSHLGFVGLNPFSSGTATVAGSGSEWNNTTDLYLGLFGSGTLNVASGGTVNNAEAYLGYFPGATGTANVSGYGSRWSSEYGLYLGGTDTVDGGIGTLNIADYGQVNAGNDFVPNPRRSAALIVSDFGNNGNLWVRNGSTMNNSGEGYIGLSYGSTGTATITGTGSQWNNSGRLFVGDYGYGTLNVEAGGKVNNENGFIGLNRYSTGIVTVSGQGSQWINSSDLIVGGMGKGTLSIEAGGFVSNSDGIVGSGRRRPLPSSPIDVATVNGDGSQWHNSGELLVSPDGVLNVEAGGLVSSENGFIGRTGSLIGVATVTGNGSQWLNSAILGVHGILNIEAGGFASNEYGYIGRGVATITGSGSQWYNSGFLRIGLHEQGLATMNIEAGGMVQSTSGYLGYDRFSTGIATVTGEGSEWINSDDLYVGRNDDAVLNVEAGGLVSNEIGYIGYAFTSTSTATVTGDGSQWNNSHGLYLGGNDGGIGTLNVADYGRVNVGGDPAAFTKPMTTLTVSDFGSNGNLWVRNGSAINNSGVAYIGYSAGASGTATVTGIGSQWTNTSDLYIGRAGNGLLLVEAGGTVNNGAAFIGVMADSTGTATVTGNGSLWYCADDLYVGRFGFGRLVVEAGGTVSTATSFLGYAATGTASVSGTGSQWISADDLYVGRDGQAFLSVDDGGAVSCASGLVGYSSGSKGIASVTGDQSQWNCSSDLLVGHSGTGWLYIEDGGKVGSAFGHIAYAAGSTGTATVNGTGSQWNHSHDLYVGREGYGKLYVEAGGTVDDRSGTIGHTAEATGTVTVTGIGSQWTNTSDLYIGRAGNGLLLVEAGGTVSSQAGLVGSATGAAGTAIISDPNSQWTIAGDLTLGHMGNGTLQVKSGGTVTSATAHLGQWSGSRSYATVTGAGSQWNNAGDLYVINGRLNAEAGGVVNSATGYLGSLSGSMWVATVTGEGSQWNCSNGLFLEGSSGPSGRAWILSIEDDGHVNVGNDPALPSEYGAVLTVSDFGSNGNLRIRNGAMIDNISNSLYGSGFIGYSPGASGTATVTGSDSLWKSSVLFVGYDGHGTLNIEAGGTINSSSGLIGCNTGSTGIATVTGNGSMWTMNEVFLVGGDRNTSGHGILSIEAGGAIRSPGSVIGVGPDSIGAVTVTGSGSYWTTSSLTVGRYGHGTLTIEAGGTVSGGGGIGSMSGSTGMVTVTGEGSQWLYSGVSVGCNGEGTLNIEAGGKVESSSSHIGEYDGSGVVTVTGDGSQWNNSHSLYLGGPTLDYDGVGTLNIADYGRVTVGDDLIDFSYPVTALTVSDFGSNGNLLVRNGSVITNSGVGYLGYSADSMGTATVTGTGSQWNNLGILYVGHYGHAALNVEAGGTVNSKDGCIGLYHHSSGIATVSGDGSQWIISSDLIVGGWSDGTLNIEAGGFVSSGSGIIGTKMDPRRFGLADVVTVNGDGSQWHNSGELLVAPDGALNVEAGGVVSSENGYIRRLGSLAGVATVTGNGSQWFNSAILDIQGILNVEAGGLVHSTSGYLGYNPYSTGIATITGDGSQWNNAGGLYLGYYGQGTLNVEAGGFIKSEHGYIAVDPNTSGTATVTGSGSRWEISYELTIGQSGQGSLNIGAGGTVSNSLGYIASLPGSTGIATVTGTGSQWNNASDLYVGLFGNGSLNVENGGVVNNASGYLGFLPGSAGTATVTGDGSQWNCSSNLTVGGGHATAGGMGTLTIQDHGLVDVADKLKTWGPGTVNLDGGTLRAGTFDPAAGTFNWTGGWLNVDHLIGDLTQDAGTLVIGNSPGTTVVEGDYTLAGSGILEVDLFGAGGAAGVDFDLLDVLGDAMLGGTLDVSLQGGFTPSAGDRFEFLTATSVLGTFDALNLPPLPGDLHWYVNYGATSVELVTTHAADFNEDGIVDIDDAVVWKSNYGTWPADHGSGDANANSFTDGSDFLAWQRQCGMGSTVAAPINTAVPEPSTALLLIAAAVSLTWMRRLDRLCF